jgi:hypothetical protein
MLVRDNEGEVAGTRQFGCERSAVEDLHHAFDLHADVSLDDFSDRHL